MEIYIIDGRYTEIAWYITAHNTQVEICSQYLTIGASMGIEWEHSLTVGYWIYLVYIPWGKWLWWNHLAAQMDLATASSGVFNQKATTKTRISRSNSKEILHDSSVILNFCQRQLKVLKAYRSCCSWCLPIFTPSQRQEETLILPIAINTSAPWRTARWARWAPWRSRRRQRHWSSWCSAECDHFSGKCHWVSILGIEQPREEVSEFLKLPDKILTFRWSQGSHPSIGSSTAGVCLDISPCCRPCWRTNPWRPWRCWRLTPPCIAKFGGREEFTGAPRQKNGVKNWREKNHADPESIRIPCFFWKMIVIPL